MQFFLKLIFPKPVGFRKNRFVDSCLARKSLQESPTEGLKIRN